VGGESEKTGSRRAQITIRHLPVVLGNSTQRPGGEKVVAIGKPLAD
jgi:hypothetical protein